MNVIYKMVKMILTSLVVIIMCFKKYEVKTTILCSLYA
jgi:hypothetical protein